MIDGARRAGGAERAVERATNLRRNTQSAAARLRDEYRLDGLAVAYDELGVQLNVQVVGKVPAPAEMATAVRTSISDHYKQPVRVRLLTRIVTDTAPVNLPVGTSEPARLQNQ